MQVSTPCLLLVECPKVLPGVLVFTLILRRWLGDFLIPFDLNDQNVVAFLDKKVGVKVASLGMFALAPGIFDGVEALECSSAKTVTSARRNDVIPTLSRALFAVLSVSTALGVI